MLLGDKGVNQTINKNPIDRKKTKCYNHLRCRGIAQFGSALGSGPRGRRFKSCCSDHLCGCSSMVERQPSKLVTRVRFPSPAPFFYPLSERIFYWENRWLVASDWWLVTKRLRDWETRRHQTLDFWRLMSNVLSGHRLIYIRGASLFLCAAPPFRISHF